MLPFDKLKVNSLSTRISAALSTSEGRNEIEKKITKHKVQRKKYESMQLEESGDTQISTSDPECRHKEKGYSAHFEAQFCHPFVGAGYRFEAYTRIVGACIEHYHRDIHSYYRQRTWKNQKSVG